MANDLNMVVIVGRLTRDPEMRYTNSGTAVCRFSLAVNRKKRSGDSWTDEVSYFDVTVWGKQAEALNNYLVKGKQVAVNGELRQNRWEQDGQKRSKIEVVANSVQLLGDPSGGGSARAPQQNRATFQQKPQTSGGGHESGPKHDYSAGPEGFDDDIPF